MNPKYPLEEIAQIKQRRLEEAEKQLKEKKEALRQEEERLKEAEQKRDAVKKRRDQKIAKFLQDIEMGTSSEKITQHKRYMKEVIDIELQQENDNVLKQKKVVEQAEKELEIAKKEYYRRHIETEKMQLHRKEWEKEARAELLRIENLEQDEIGTHIHKRNQDGG